MRSNYDSLKDKKELSQLITALKSSLMQKSAMPETTHGGIIITILLKTIRHQAFGLETDNLLESFASIMLTVEWESQVLARSLLSMEEIQAIKRLIWLIYGEQVRLSYLDSTATTDQIKRDTTIETIQKSLDRMEMELLAGKAILKKLPEPSNNSTKESSTVPPTQPSVDLKKVNWKIGLVKFLKLIGLGK